MRKHVAISLMIIFAFLGCEKKPTENDIIALNDMKVILWDMSNADAFFNQISLTDSVHKTRAMTIQLYEQVFLSHNITKKQFYNSYQYYETKPDKLKTLMDSVVAYGERVKISYKGPKKF